MICGTPTPTEIDVDEAAAASTRLMRARRADVVRMRHSHAGARTPYVCRECPLCILLYFFCIFCVFFVDLCLGFVFGNCSKGLKFVASM